MSEQEPTTTAIQATRTSICPHAEAIGKRWGDPISEERARQLQDYLDGWHAETDHWRRKGPFDSIELELNGADVFWLAERSPHDSLGTALDLHLEAADLRWVHLEGANLRRAHLRDTNFLAAHLEHADLRNAHLEGAMLAEAHLVHADLSGARLRKANFHEANLERSHLVAADMRRTFLRKAWLKGADLHLAQLEGASLIETYLEEANLRQVRFDENTNLTDAQFGPGLLVDWLDYLRRRNRNVALGDIKWRNADLTAVPWERIGRLGDERDAHNPINWEGKPKNRHEWVTGYEIAARANRQLANALRSQGLSEDADRFAYRAQICRRSLLRRQGIQKLPEYLWWLFLWMTAGYGYRLWRILATYVGVLTFFTVIYCLLGVHSHPGESGLQALWDSFLVSLSAIHGRTMFEQLGAWSSAAWVAAIESVVGIVIEGIFVAMLIQRFFAR